MGRDDVVFGFKYQNGLLKPVISPRTGFRTGASTVITSLNENGDIVGNYGGSRYFHAADFILGPSGTYTYFGVSQYSLIDYAYGNNNLGDIVGSSYVSSTESNSGFKLSGGTYTYFIVPGQLSTIAFGINDSGQIVGETGDLNPVGQGFIYENGTYSLVSHPNAYLTVLTGVNDLGVMAGYYETADQTSYVGFTYDGGVFTDISLPQLGTNSVQILGITNAGVLYGSYFSSATQYSPDGFVATPVSGDKGTLEHIDVWEK